jgi:hypothetical protein
MAGKRENYPSLTKSDAMCTKGVLFSHVPPEKFLGQLTPFMPLGKAPSTRHKKLPKQGKQYPAKPQQKSQTKGDR